MHDPVVSVIIPCFNHGQYLPEAVESAERCHSVPLEIIIIDDGSTDELTRKVFKQMEAKGHHVIVRPHEGQPASRNAGIRASHGRYIFALDADNRVAPQYIIKGVRILDKHERVGVVYSDAWWFGEQEKWYRAGRFDLNRLMLTNYIDTCALFRKTVWQDVGGYDSEMCGFEDWGLWLAAAARGWKFHYIPEPLYEYRVCSDSAIRTLLKDHVYVKRIYTTVWMKYFEQIYMSLQYGSHALYLQRNSRGLRFIDSALRETFWKVRSLCAVQRRKMINRLGSFLQKLHITKR